MERTIKVGDRIRHSLFSGTTLEGKVIGITKCFKGSKQGTDVQSMPFNSYDRSYILDIDNGHWCYDNQVIKVLEN